jgi:hypothetical protein
LLPAFTNPFVKEIAMSIERLRRVARKSGYSLSTRHGGWMIIDRWSNTVVDGSAYDLSVQDLAERLPALKREGWAL